MFAQRLSHFQTRLAQAGIDVALITDDDNVYYLTGYYDYLHMDFGRPTILVVPKDDQALLITPEIDLNAAKQAARVGRIAPWNDGMGDEWRAELPGAVTNAGKVAIEPGHMPPPVRAYVDDLLDADKITSATPILNDMRMIKSPVELQLARHAGQVATAMMDAAGLPSATAWPNLRWRLPQRRQAPARLLHCWSPIMTMVICPR